MHVSKAEEALRILAWRGGKKMKNNQCTRYLAAAGALFGARFSRGVFVLGAHFEKRENDVYLAPCE